MYARFRYLLIAIGLCTVPAPAYSDMPDARDITVAIDRDGDTFAVKVELLPSHEIRSRVTEGDMRGSSFATTIATKGTKTQVDNRGTFISNRWIPPIIGNTLLEAETRKQFQEFRIEILRRKGVTPGPGK